MKEQNLNKVRDCIKSLTSVIDEKHHKHLNRILNDPETYMKDFGNEDYLYFNINRLEAKYIQYHIFQKLLDLIEMEKEISSWVNQKTEEIHVPSFFDEAKKLAEEYDKSAKRELVTFFERPESLPMFIAEYLGKKYSGRIFPQMRGELYIDWCHIWNSIDDKTRAEAIVIEAYKNRKP